ncbi:hypothetical protein HPB47_002056 [Ixodes persulcatus]|uniref:Uncharacterized protein n=1 Tax=Ixodes persulcatus TaxID=34615 RepID=A0AC60PMJ1_IXOPE|nr:hypothetical protein HPB47_002056 [Ixodes persulcatus]
MMTPKRATGFLRDDEARVGQPWGHCARGDFNCVLCSTDRAGGVARKDSSATTLRDVLRDHDVVDVTSSKAVEARHEEQALTGTLRIILEEEEKRPGAFAEAIRHCKTRFQEMLEERLRGAQVRNQELFLEGETRPTKIFRTFERKRAQANHISNVRYEGHQVSGQEEVAAAFESHYKKLFCKQECDASTHHAFLHELATVLEILRT